MVTNQKQQVAGPCSGWACWGGPRPTGSEGEAQSVLDQSSRPFLMQTNSRALAHALPPLPGPDS